MLVRINVKKASEVKKAKKVFKKPYPSPIWLILDKFDEIYAEENLVGRANPDCYFDPCNICIGSYSCPGYPELIP